MKCLPINQIPFAMLKPSAPPLPATSQDFFTPLLQSPSHSNVFGCSTLINKTESVGSFNSTLAPSLGCLNNETAGTKQQNEGFSITNKHELGYPRHESTCSAENSNSHSPLLSP